MWTQRIMMVFEASDDDHEIDVTLDEIAAVLTARGHTHISTRRLRSEIR